MVATLLFAALLAQPPGAWVPGPDEALTPPHQALNSVRIDLDGDGRKESAVLFGPVVDGRPTRVTGLLLLSPHERRRGRRIEGVVEFPDRAHVGRSFAGRERLAGLRDLDGDGRREIVVEERLSEPGVTRQVLSWWSWGGADKSGLRLLHESEQRYRDEGLTGLRGPREVKRTLRRVEGSEPPELVEAVEDGERRYEQRFRLDATRGRFVPVE